MFNTKVTGRHYMKSFLRAGTISKMVQHNTYLELKSQDWIKFSVDTLTTLNSKLYKVLPWAVTKVILIRPAIRTTQRHLIRCHLGQYSTYLWRSNECDSALGLVIQLSNLKISKHVGLTGKTGWTLLWKILPSTSAYSASQTIRPHLSNRGPQQTTPLLAACWRFMFHNPPLLTAVSAVQFPLLIV